MSEITKYRKKPVVIEAMHWDGTATGATPIINWILSSGSTARYSGPVPPSDDCPTPEFHIVHRCCPSCEFAHEEVALSIDTLEGTMKAASSDYILKGIQGEFYPCKPDIFAATYEAVQ